MNIFLSITSTVDTQLHCGTSGFLAAAKKETHDSDFQFGGYMPSTIASSRPSAKRSVRFSRDNNLIRYHRIITVAVSLPISMCSRELNVCCLVLLKTRAVECLIFFIVLIILTRQLTHQFDRSVYVVRSICK